ncbi:hypothetical protein [Thalassococcus profundi]|uniref:hypothetical protein n=1 Tax=Thalassococcus profundi TaxID=2282382 RepID=UPI001F2D417B|nr:hypothetical protein [Thalassococcus profundi]
MAIECSKALLLDMPRPSQSGYALLPLARPHGDEKVRNAEHHLSGHFARDVLPATFLSRNSPTSQA